MLLETHTIPSQIGGFIRHFDLVDWWLASFSPLERIYMQQRFQPPGYPPQPLAQGRFSIDPPNETCVSFLTRLAGWFAQPQNLALCNRILDKAESGFADHTRFVEAHLCYDQRIRIASDTLSADPKRHKSAPTLQKRTVISCELQIFIAEDTAREIRRYRRRMPGHRGFAHLIRLREQQKDFERTMVLSEQAMRQGWAGDWSDRIQRCQHRLRETKANWA